MKEIYLLRHASAVNELGVDDFERALAPTAIHECNKIVEHLIKMQIKPDLIICSQAFRAIQTKDNIFSKLSIVVDIYILPLLYNAEMQDIINIINSIDHDVNSILIIGHNPALYETCQYFSLHSEPELIAKLSMKGMPPATLAYISSKAVWSNINQHNSSLQELYIV
jgi:phosphohistidine phosphatase